MQSMAGETQLPVTAKPISPLQNASRTVLSRPAMPPSSRPSWVLIALATTVLARPVVAQPAPGLKAPPGFEVTEYADSSLANDIYTMTVDPKGRLVVAGKGYIRILVDGGAGRATKAL